MSDSANSAPTLKSVNITEPLRDLDLRIAFNLIDQCRGNWPMITSGLQANRLHNYMLKFIGYSEVKTDDPNVTTIGDILRGNFETVGGYASQLTSLIDQVICTFVTEEVKDLYLENRFSAVTFEVYSKMLKEMKNPKAWKVRELLEPVEKRRLPFQEMVNYTIFVAEITSAYDAILKQTLLKYLPKQQVWVFEQQSGTADFEAYNNMEFKRYAIKLRDFYRSLQR